jgi:hypothetical protein
MAMSTSSGPVGYRSMDGFRYRYSAATPSASAAGTTTVSRMNPCTWFTVAFVELLKSTTAALPPGLSTRRSSAKARGMSLTLRKP